MKEHPILFSSEMVCAILEGRKTQTRRIINPQPDEEDSHLDTGCVWYAPTIIVKDMEEPGPEVFGFSSLERGWKCPYGAPGDHLWVREAWATHAFNNRIKPSRLTPGDTEIVYRANKWNNDSHFAWRPSIFMPRWASRITLEIVNVRVERLKDITKEGVRAEGACGFLENAYDEFEDFQFLWDSINASRGYSWESNPWVWVIEFKKVTL